MGIKHQLKSFKLAYFYSEVDKEFLAGQMNSGVLIEGLDGRDNLTGDELEATNKIVAVAGVHPFITLTYSGTMGTMGTVMKICISFFCSSKIHENMTMPTYPKICPVKGKFGELSDFLDKNIS